MTTDITVKKEQTLRELYYDPATGFQGAESLYRKAKEEGITGITHQEVKDWLTTQLTYTLHKPIRRHSGGSRRVFVTKIDEQWQADLVEMGQFAGENGGVRYLLTVIDILSKYAWAVPIKTKTGDDVLKAMKGIIKESGRRPDKLQTDEGREFTNKKMQDFLESTGIHWFHTYSDKKASVVERFNRTLKGLMWKYFTYKGTHRWVDQLPQFLENYNSTVHSSIKMKPRDVTPENDHRAFQVLYGHEMATSGRKPKFSIGEKVRITKYKGIFKKGYLPNWTEEIFIIKHIIYSMPPVYKIVDLQDEEILGTFYEDELQAVDDTGVYRIEKILKKKKVKGQTYYLIKWKGYPDSFNSWEKDSNVIST